MNFESFLSELKRANPKLFAAEKIEIKINSLEVQLKRAYDAGHEHGLKFGKDLGSFNKNNMGDLFGGIFK